MKRTSIVLAICLTALAAPVLADEGRIPIFAAPTVIAAPGKYFVTGNLAIGAGSLITITVDNVDVDLNGFVLSSTAAAPVVTSTGVSGITIRNGTISGGSENIEITSATRVVIEDVQAAGATGAGISFVDSTQLAVRRSVVRGAATNGIQIDNTPAVPSAEGTLSDNLIESCGEGINISSAGAGTSGSSVAILNNRLRNVTGNGIYYAWGTGCLISDNTLANIGSYGMFLQTDRSRISNNVVSNAGAGGGAFGIQQNGSDNLILANVVGQSGNRGFVISGFRNNIEGNTANNNGSFGFHITGSGHVYRRNVARGNAGVAGNPPACGAPCSPDLCVSPAGAATATSAGDNYLPGPPGFAGCI